MSTAIKIRGIAGMNSEKKAPMRPLHSPDHKVGWQLLKYMMEILKQWEKENPDWERLPAIVPFVFYHGAEAWPGNKEGPNEFLHLVDAEEGWGPYLLNFRFPVLDLGVVPDTELSEYPRLRPWLVAMKYATRKDRQAAVVELLIGSLKDAPEDFDPITYYLVRVYGYDEPTLRRIVREVRPKEEEKMMSQFAEDIRSQFAQEIESRVRQSVLQQGEHKKAVEMARTLLGDGVAVGVISKASGLSEEELRKLSAH